MNIEHRDYYRQLSVIEPGHSDDLVLEDDHCRVWVSRCETSVDGGPLVTIEHLVNGKWEIADSG